MSDAQMKIQIGADVQGAVSGLNQVAASTAKTTAALNKMPNVSNQATQSLSNLSRVAQDMPYGFIGIANNLNPLLESFQRLKATTGSTGGALKALAGSLMGAGGLGLAIGVVSSLLVAFSMHSGKAKKDTEQLKEASTKAADAQKAFKSAIDSASSSVLSQQNVLKELQSVFIGTISASDGLTNAIVSQGLARLLFNEKNVELQKILSAEVEKEFLLRQRGVGVGGVKEFKVDTQLQQLKTYQKSLIDLGKSDPDLNRTISRIEELNDIIGNSGGSVNMLNQIGKGLESIIKTFITPNIKINPGKVEVQKPRDLSFVKDFDFESALFSKIKIPKLKVGYTLESPGSAAGNADPSDNFIERQIQNMNALGDTITGFVTPAFDAMFATIAKGGNVFKAFGQAIIQSLVQVISKLITTVALAAILSAVTGGAAGLGFKGMSGFKNIFSGLMGFRAGGGPVSAGLAYRVGERGPETFIPETSGRMVPASQGRISQGSMAMALSGQFRVSGNDLVLVLANANRSQNRLV